MFSSIRKFSVGSLALSVMFLVLTQYFVNFKFYKTDFLVFYSAAKLYLQTPQDLYINMRQIQSQFQVLADAKVTDAELGYGPFVNLPVALLPFLLVSNLEPHLAFRIVSLVYFVLTCVCIFFMQKILLPKSRVTLFDFLINITFIPVFIMIVATQNSLLFLISLLLTLYFYTNDRHFLAGITAPLMLLSPQLAFFVLFSLIMYSGKKFIVGFCLGIASFLLSNLMMVNWQPQSFFKIFWWYSTIYESRIQKTFTMVSIQGFLSQLSLLIGNIESYKIALILSILLFTLSIYVIYSQKHRRVAYINVLPLVIITTLLCGMHVHWQSVTPLMLMYWHPALRVHRTIFNSALVVGWVIMALAYFSPFYPMPFYFLPTIYLSLLWVLEFRRLHFSAQYLA